VQVVVHRCLKPTIQSAPEEDYFGSIDQSDNPCLIDDAHIDENGIGDSSLPPSTNQLAILCVPARFVPTDLISMLNPYHDHIESVRLLRHFDDPRQFIAYLCIDTEVEMTLDSEV
jgi:hypothetical protein